MKITTRDIQNDREHIILSDDAAFCDESEGRISPIDNDLYRNDYQRDRDKILHTKAFRRLSHKTQVFIAPIDDHYRTRLTHTLEVSQIARTIARALSLNEDLVEAISLGHDLGHTPFGHVGEEALSDSIAKHLGINVPKSSSQLLYRHNVQSLRVVDVIENNGKGLNLTYEVRNGIICHTGSRRAETLEGRIVAIADRIAYVNHDIDDALRAGSLQENDLPISTHAILGANHSTRIQTLVQDTIETSSHKGDIVMSDKIWDAMMELRSFLFENVYTSPPVMKEVSKAKHLVEDLFDYFIRHYDQVPLEYQNISDGNHLRAVTDYIAGMTDRFAKNFFEDMFIPHDWNV